MLMIRPFEPGDLDQCAELYVHVFGEPPWNEHWTVDDARKHLQQAIDTPGFEALVAAEGDRVIGVVTGNRKCTSAGEALLLDDMYIDAEFRSQGLGRRMMDDLKRRMVGHVTAFALFTQHDTRAAGFYRDYGFIEDPSLRFMLLGIEMHAEA